MQLTPWLLALLAPQDPQEPRIHDTPRGPVVETLHGEPVADPYRWMEDLEAPAVQRFFDEQDLHLEHYLSAATGRDELAARIAALSHFDRRSTPIRRGDRIFYSETPAGAQGPTVYVEETAGDGPARIVLTPAEWIQGRGRYGGFTVSPDGSRLAFGISEGPGSFSLERVLDVDTGTLLDAGVRDVWGGVTWTRDGSAFYYTRFPPRDPGGKRTEGLGLPRVFLHRVGTPQSSDTLVYAAPTRPDWLLRNRPTRDHRWLLLSLSAQTDFRGLRDQLLIRELDPSEGALRELVAPGTARVSFEGMQGDELLFRTDHGAPNLRLMACRPEAPAPEHWREVVPELEAALTWVSEFENELVLHYVQDARSLVRIHNRDGTLRHELRPTRGATLGGFGDDPGARFAYCSEGGLCDPGAVDRIDLVTGEREPYWRPKLDYDPDDFETRQVFYHADDGTRIPMFLVGRRGFEADGSAPVFLYAYGALGWSASPWYQPHMIPFLEQGGLYALANIRGGGEYGEAWHAAGRGRNKLTSLSDYVDAAEFLIDAGYTKAGNVIANGASASGVLAASAVMRSPELFGAAIVEHPKLDLLRYHRFTGSNFSTAELGDPEDPEDFAVLRSYSPVHNVDPEVELPPILVMVGEDDTTNPPFHGAKWVAELQARSPNSRAFLQVLRGTGHSYGGTPEMRARTWATAWAFVDRALAASESPNR